LGDQLSANQNRTGFRGLFCYYETCRITRSLFIRANRGSSPEIPTAWRYGIWRMGGSLSDSLWRGKPTVLCFSPDGGRFAAFHPNWEELDGARRIVIHDATNPRTKELTSQILTDDVTSVAWHPDGRGLIVPDHGGAVHWMDSQSGAIETLGRHKYQAVRAAFTPDGAYVFTAGWGRDLICWDARARRRALTASLNTDQIQVRADGRECSVLTQTGVQLYAFEQPMAHREFVEDLGVRLQHANMSADGRWLAASGDKRAGLWDLTAGGRGALDTNAYEADFFFTANGRELFASRTQGPAACFRWQMIAATNSGGSPALKRFPCAGPKISHRSACFPTRWS
jgi:WD40 repeat protein